MTQIQTEKQSSETSDFLLEFYLKGLDDLETHCDDIIAKTSCFETRLKAMIHHRIEILGQHREHAIHFTSLAIDPRSSASTINNSDSIIKRRTLKILNKLIEGSNFCSHQELAPFVPTLIWYYMGFIIYFWIHDTSNQQTKTTHLINSLTPLVLKPIFMSRFSFAAAAVRPVIQLLQSFIKIN